MRRRNSPYSRIEEVQRSRGEMWMLVIVTVFLGVLLGLFTDSLYEWLYTVLSPFIWPYVFIVTGILTLLFTLAVAWLFYGQIRSKSASIDLWLPYHFPQRDRLIIAKGTSYQPPRHAQRAFSRRYRRNSDALKELLGAWHMARSGGKLFQHFIADDFLALTQCLTIYILHRYGQSSLGAKAPYSWCQVSLPSRSLTISELPPPLRDNSFLHADQEVAEWKLLLPDAVSFEIVDHTWILRHRRYGCVTIHWYPEILVADPHSQPYRALTTRMKLKPNIQLYVVGCRIEAMAQPRRVLLPDSEPFQKWSAGLLARLEEGLDLGYYIAQRPERVMRDLEWKIGWIPENTSLVDMLESISARLEALEMREAEKELGAQEEEPDVHYVV